MGYLCVTLQFCSLLAAITPLHAGQCFTFPSQQFSDCGSTVAVRSEVSESDQVLRGVAGCGCGTLPASCLENFAGLPTCL